MVANLAKLKVMGDDATSTPTNVYNLPHLSHWLKAMAWFNETHLVLQGKRHGRTNNLPLLHTKQRLTLTPPHIQKIKSLTTLNFQPPPHIPTYTTATQRNSFWIGVNQKIGWRMHTEPARCGKQRGKTCSMYRIFTYMWLISKVQI